MAPTVENIDPKKTPRSGYRSCTRRFVSGQSTSQTGAFGRREGSQGPGPGRAIARHAGREVCRRPQTEELRPPLRRRRRRRDNLTSSFILFRNQGARVSQYPHKWPYGHPFDLWQRTRTLQLS